MLFYVKAPEDSNTLFYSEVNDVFIVSETTAAKYLYMVNVTYSFMNSTISNCQTSLTTKLKEVIPTQSVLTCEFDGGNQNITFLVTDVKYDSIQNQSVSIYVGMYLFYVCWDICMSPYVCLHIYVSVYMCLCLCVSECF